MNLSSWNLHRWKILSGHGTGNTSTLRFRRLSQICEKRLITSSCLSVRPPTCEQLGSNWKNFNEIWYLSIFRKSVEKIEVSLKYDKNNGTLHEDLCTFKIISRWIVLRMIYIWNKSRENQNTLFSNFFFRKSCYLWDNVEKYGRARQARDDNIIRRNRFACWVTKATNTHSEYVTLIAFPRQQWLGERASMLRVYVHCLSCWVTKTVKVLPPATKPKYRLNKVHNVAKTTDSQINCTVCGRKR
jgi:hypothetical protein